MKRQDQLNVLNDWVSPGIRLGLAPGHKYAKMTRCEEAKIQNTTQRNWCWICTLASSASWIFQVSEGWWKCRNSVFFIGVPVDSFHVLEVSQWFVIPPGMLRASKHSRWWRQIWTVNYSSCQTMEMAQCFAALSENLMKIQSVGQNSSHFRNPSLFLDGNDGIAKNNQVCDWMLTWCGGCLFPQGTQDPGLD